jgi:outer membrane protein assembly factor BamB
VIAVVALLGALLVPLAESRPPWPQWGGPNRDFTTSDPGLAESWPDGGPRTIWRRPLGDGLSAIVSDGEALFTLYRDGADDVIVSLDAATGRTRWETRLPSPFQETCSERLGPAPRAAPLLTAGRVISVSAGGQLRSLDQRTGTVQWTLELVPQGSEAAKPCGYATSPVAYKDTIITMAGGRSRGVVAIDAATGRERWASQDFMNGYSSPILVDLDGRPEVIAFTAGEVSGLNPDTGALEWTVPHPADFGVNVMMPIFGADRLLFVSSAYNGGSRVLRLTRTATGVTADEIWAHRRVRIHFGNAVRIGDRIYASNGDFGTAPFAAVDVTTGDMLWRDRAVGRATLIAAGRRLLILDEEGVLTLATPGDAGLQVHARTQVFNERSWTAPTLVGTTLVARNRREIVALDLGR